MERRHRTAPWGWGDSWDPPNPPGWGQCCNANECHGAAQPSPHGGSRGAKFSTEHSVGESPITAAPCCRGRFSSRVLARTDGWWSGTYQGPLQGEHSSSPGALQGFHPTSPTAAAEGIGATRPQVEAPAQQRGVFPALAVLLVLLVLRGRAMGGSAPPGGGGGHCGGGGSARLLGAAVGSQQL